MNTLTPGEEAAELIQRLTETRDSQARIIAELRRERDEANKRAAAWEVMLREKGWATQLAETHKKRISAEAALALAEETLSRAESVLSLIYHLRSRAPLAAALAEAVDILRVIDTATAISPSEALDRIKALRVRLQEAGWPVEKS